MKDVLQKQPNSNPLVRYFEILIEIEKSIEEEL